MFLKQPPKNPANALNLSISDLLNFRSQLNI